MIEPFYGVGGFDDRLKRDSFVFPRSFYEAIKNLKPKDQLLLFCAVCEYGLNGKIPNLSGDLQCLSILIKFTIDNNEKIEGN